MAGEGPLLRSIQQGYTQYQRIYSPFTLSTRCPRRMQNAKLECLWSGAVPGPVYRCCEGRSESKNGKVLKGALKSLRIQSLVALGLALLSLMAGPVAAASSFFGSLCVYIPGLVFTLMVMRKLGGDTGAFLRTAAIAEFGKLALTGILCAVVFIYVKPLAPGFFFLGMIGVLAASWAGLAIMFRE